MGIVWEAYHKGVPLLGVPENPTDLWNTPLNLYQQAISRDSFHNWRTGDCRLVVRFWGVLQIFLEMTLLGIVTLPPIIMVQ